MLALGEQSSGPSGRQEKVLEELHEAHPGVVRMKALARNYVWWPGIDKELEETVRSCETCQLHARNPPGAPLHPWEFPAKPWSRLHVDYAGPFLGKIFLLVIDAFSKWLDVYMVQSATSQATIDKLRVSFAIHGLPDVIVSDNGSCFTSGDFEAFCHCQGIIHTKSAPYHPATNGLAERAVQTFKQGMKKLHPGSLEERLQTFLMYYKNSPHATTERTPAELLLGRSPKTVLDLIKPDLSGKVMKKQVLQKSYHDKTSRDRQFQLGEAVYVRNFGRGGVWMPATISQILGPVSYACTTKPGSQVKRHVDHIRTRHPVGPRRSTPEVTGGSHASRQRTEGLFYSEYRKCKGRGDTSFHSTRDCPEFGGDGSSVGSS